MKIYSTPAVACDLQAGAMINIPLQPQSKLDFTPNISQLNLHCKSTEFLFLTKNCITGRE